MDPQAVIRRTFDGILRILRTQDLPALNGLIQGQIGQIAVALTGLQAQLDALAARITALEQTIASLGGGPGTTTNPYVVRTGDTVDPNTPITIETR